MRELAEALALLRQQRGACAAYWRCPCCDTRLLDAAAFVQHVQLYHEEVQYSAEGAAVQCTKCLKEVRAGWTVGAAQASASCPRAVAPLTAVWPLAVGRCSAGCCLLPVLLGLLLAVRPGCARAPRVHAGVPPLLGVLGIAAWQGAQSVCCSPSPAGGGRTLSE